MDRQNLEDVSPTQSDEASSRPRDARVRPFRSFTREDEFRLGHQIIDSRTALLHAFCDHPPALRVLARWYGAVAEGRVEPKQLFDYRPAESSNPDRTLNRMHARQDFSEIRDISRQISAGAGQLADAPGRDRTAFVTMLAACRPRDQNLETLAEACIAASPDETGVKAIGTAWGRLRIAKTKLFNNFQKLCDSLAVKQVNRGVDQADLGQEARIGLMKAVEKYDPAFPNRFSTFAAYWIHQEINHAVQSKGRTIYLPPTVIKNLHRIKKAEETLSRHGEIPASEAVSRKSGVAVAQIENLKALAPAPTSLDMPAGKDGQMTFGELIEDKQAPNALTTLAQADLRDKTAGLIDKLPAREAEIIRRRFGIGVSEPQTLEDISRDFNITRERVRQIEAKALRQLHVHARRLAEDYVPPSRAAGHVAPSGLNDDVAERLIHEWDKGKTTAQIGRVLTKETGTPVSQHTVAGMAALLRLAPRPAPTVKGEQPR